MTISTDARKKLSPTRPAYLLGGIVLAGIVLTYGLGIAPIAKSADSPLTVRAESDDVMEPVEDDDEAEAEADLDKFKERAKARRLEREKAAKEAEKSNWFPTGGSDEGNMGIFGQVGHNAFKTFGRPESISPFEIMPYVLADEHYFFSDLRGFVSNSATVGGNAGVGYRNLREDLNSWFGGSLWFDMDGTTGKYYQQIGLSFEAMIQRFELRSNVYLPITSSQTYANTISNARFSGNQLLYTQYIDQGKALTGADFELGYNIPVMEPHRLRGFVGYYRFDGGPNGSINGFKTRVEGVINNTVTAQVLYTNDALYGSNVMLGLQFQFPFGDNHPTSKWSQTTPSPYRFVERNYNVIVDQVQQVDPNVVAINPLTSDPYSIQQVSSTAAPGGNGTTNSPFTTVAAAQAAGADVIFVHGNSVLNQTVTLSNGQSLIGDGSSEQLALPGGRTVTLPNLIAAAQTPEFSSVNGTAVTLGSNSEVAGFKFTGINGSAIAGATITNGTIRDDTFTNITGSAIDISGASGTFLVSNVLINGTGGDGLKFDAGSGTANVTFNGSVTGTQGDGIAFSNFSGGIINMTNTTISTTTGAGLFLNDVDTTVNIFGLSTAQTSGAAVEITGGVAGNLYTFADTTTIQTPSGVGFSFANSAASLTVNDLVVTSTASADAVSLTNSTGPIILTYLDVTTTNATALATSTLSSLTITNGILSTYGAPAVDIETSLIAATFSQINTDTGPYGIKLNQDVGTFSLVGANALGSAGTIEYTTTGVILNQAGTTTLTWLNLISNGTGIQSTLNATVTLSDLQITNSPGYALDSLNDGAMVLQDSILSGNGAVGGGTIRGQVSTESSNYQWLISGNTISDANGTAIQLTTQPGGAGSSLVTTIENNAITGSYGTASLINVNWNGPMSVLVSGNTLAADGGNMTGVNVQDTSTTATATAQITTNTITFAENSGTGVMLAAAFGSSYQVDTNNITFGGIDGIGLRFNLSGGTNTGAGGNIYIFSNTITDDVGGATGMLFDNASSGSRIQIDNNVINLLATDPTIHQGIIFTQASPTIQFTSQYNNIINNASSGDLFNAPVNSSTGDLLINGTLMVPE